VDLVDRRYPSPAQVYDYFLTVVSIDPSIVWPGWRSSGSVSKVILQPRFYGWRSGCPTKTSRPIFIVFSMRRGVITDLLRESIGLDRLFFEVVVFETIQPGAIEFCLTVREFSAHVKDRVAPVLVVNSNADKPHQRLYSR